MIDKLQDADQSERTGNIAIGIILTAIAAVSFGQMQKVDTALPSNKQVAAQVNAQKTTVQPKLSTDQVFFDY